MSRRILIIGGAMVVILGLLCGGYFAVRAFLLRPLGQPLEIATASATPVPTIPSGFPTAVAPTQVPTLVRTPTQVGVCGHEQPMTVLVLLMQDAKSGVARQMTAARLVEVDFAGQAVSSVYFPPKVLLTVGPSTGLPVGQMRLDTVFSEGLKKSLGNPAQATNVVAQALYDTFGVAPQHYLAIDFSSMARTIDAVGGVDVQVLVTYDGTPYKLPKFNPGVTHMDGKLALGFAMARSGQTVWEALSRQTQVLKALGAKALSPSIIPNLPRLIQQFQSTVFTDLSLQQGTDFACLAAQLPPDRLSFFGVDANYVTVSANGDLVPRVDAVKVLLSQTFTSVP